MNDSIVAIEYRCQTLLCRVTRTPSGKYYFRRRVKKDGKWGWETIDGNHRTLIKRLSETLKI